MLKFKVSSYFYDFSGKNEPFNTKYLFNYLTIYIFIYYVFISISKYCNRILPSLMLTYIHHPLFFLFIDPSIERPSSDLTIITKPPQLSLINLYHSNLRTVQTYPPPTIPPLYHDSTILKSIHSYTTKQTTYLLAIVKKQQNSHFVSHQLP